jgi:anti-sigma regulatory factor (Ser/Thr protein kinase)
MPTLTPLIVPGRLDSLKPIRDYVMNASALAGLDKVFSNRLRLAVDEIVTNAIVHGYEESGTQGDIRIEASLDDKQLIIVVEDTGPHYDPTQHDMPTEEYLQTPLDTRDIGGLGIYLTVNSTDEFHFERIGNRNRNIFVMYRPVDK